MVVETVAWAKGWNSVDAAGEVTAEEYRTKELSVGRGEVSGGPWEDGEEALLSKTAVRADASSPGVGLDGG